MHFRRNDYILKDASFVSDDADAFSKSISLDRFILCFLLFPKKPYVRTRKKKRFVALPQLIEKKRKKNIQN